MAEALYERCQEILEKALGPEHVDVATTLHERAVMLKSQVRVGKHVGNVLRRILEVADLMHWVGAAEDQFRAIRSVLGGDLR